MRRMLPSLLLLLCALSTARAQDDMDAVEIKTAPLGHGLHLVTGRGGNILASVGTDGVFIRASLPRPRMS